MRRVPNPVLRGHAETSFGRARSRAVDVVVEVLPYAAFQRRRRDAGGSRARFHLW